MWSPDETTVRLVPKKAESAHVFASRAFVTVTLAANMRGGMWTQIVYEVKTDRVHPHGPLFPRQLVSHSPTRWITQEALLDMIDAIDADMHAGPGEAEQRKFKEYTQPLDRAYMRTLKSSIRSEVAKLFAAFFLEAESNFQRANLDSTTRCSDSCCYNSRTEQQHRTQTARNIKPLAGASSIGMRWSSASFSQKQDAFWRRENCFHEAQPRSFTRQRRTCWSHWQTITAAKVTTHPLVSRNQRHQRRHQLPLLQREQP